MPRSRKGMNVHQKAVFREGEHRVRGQEIESYLELACSDDPEDRLEAAENLCPCHVRTRIDEVQQAVYRLMEDADARVRWAAWHTLEDGGCPTDPTLDDIFARAVRNETDEQVRRFVEMFAVPRRQEQDEIAFQRAQRSLFAQRGKCDFCAATDVPVKTDYETEIDTGQKTARFARICKLCAAAT